MRSMRILYAAIDQRVPGADGGSVHVGSVASGLAALGHEVHVLATAGAGAPPEPAHWHAESPVLGIRQLRLLSAGRVARRRRSAGTRTVVPWSSPSPRRSRVGGMMHEDVVCAC